MIRLCVLAAPVTAFLITAAALPAATVEETRRAPSSNAAGPTVDLFQAMEDGQVNVKFMAKSDREGRLLITNKTKQPLHLQLPEAFAGVPALAQLGGGGFGGGGRGGGGFGGGGGGQQSVGGGLGGGGGLQGGGGGGGFFSIPPEETAKLNFPVVCLDHGLRNPSSSRPYKIVPASQHIQRPEVIELLKAFGTGTLDHAATQAAAWHLNSNKSWAELTAMRQGTRRTPNRPPYFNQRQIQAAMAYAAEAIRRGEANAESYQLEREERLKKAQEKEIERSEERSTTDADTTASESETE
jgi:hypothetical protein